MQFTRKPCPFGFLRVDQPSTQAFRRFLGLPSRRDIERGTPYQNRPAFAELDAAAGSDPSHLTIRKHYPVFTLVVAGVLSIRERLTNSIPIVGMQPLHETFEVQSLGFREAKQLAPCVARPDFVSW